MPQLQPFWVTPFTVDSPGPYAPVGDRVFGDITLVSGVNATYQANPWDTATIKGIRVPGLVSVSVSRKQAIMTIAAVGVIPENTALGFEQLRFTMTVKLWTPAQWAAFQPIMWMLQPIRAKQPKGLTAENLKKWNDGHKLSAFDVHHPALAAHSVYSCICEDLGPLVGEQVKTYTFKFLEFRKGKNKVQTIEASQVAEVFNADVINVRADNGNLVSYTPTHGPQQKPSQSVSLSPTP